MSTLEPILELPFQHLLPGVGAGKPPPPGWVGLERCPLLIMVGVTGVGKSTTLRALAERLPFRLLPDRRVLTDHLIIAAMRATAGETAEPVRDRAQRFALTRRFREHHPGGLADVLPVLAIEPPAQALLVFDGLRGENEVRAACALLPHARFVHLDAPDAVRVLRLLQRADTFDQMSAAPRSRASAEGVMPAEAAGLFTPQEVAAFVNLVAHGAVAADELRAKIAIVLEERRNYDPAATRAALLRCGDRTLLFDTSNQTAQQAAHAIAAWAQGWLAASSTDSAP